VTVTVTNGANSRLRTIDWSVNAQLPGDFNQDGSVDTADYVVWRKLGGSQGSYDTWRANFGSTAAAGSQALSASFSIDDPLLVSVAQANAPEDGAGEGAETMDNQREFLVAHDRALSAVAPAWPEMGNRRALFHASQRCFDGRHSELGTSLLARQLAFAALTKGEKDHADPFVFGNSDEIDEQEMFQKSFDGLFDLTIDFAEVSCRRSRALRK
jgi:hypothetical protein